MRIAFVLLFGAALLPSLLTPSSVQAQGVRWSADAATYRPHSRPPTTAQCVPDTPLLTPSDSIGPIKSGSTLADIEAVCEEVEYAWVSLEGEESPVVITKLGEISVVFEMHGTSVTSGIYRASTSSEAARTEDGVGPGVELIEVKALWPDLGIAFGEGVFALSRQNPGYSLEIDIPEGADPMALWRVRDTGDWSLLPQGVVVSRVLLLGIH